MLITSTKTHALDRLKILVYGAPGVGKTTLAGTLKEKVLIISAEAGTLSLNQKEIDVIDITTNNEGKPIAKELRPARLREVFEYVMKPETQEKYQWLFIDSLTEVSQNVLDSVFAAQPEGVADGFKIWGEYNKQCTALVKAFRDLPCYNVVFTALETEDKDENNRRFLRVDMQGKVGKKLPAYFDEVFWLHVDDKSGERKMFTSTRDQVVAKDRSGRLDTEEPASLSLVVRKIRGKVTAVAPQTNGGNQS